MLIAYEPARPRKFYLPPNSANSEGYISFLPHERLYMKILYAYIKKKKIKFVQITREEKFISAG